MDKNSLFSLIAIYIYEIAYIDLLLGKGKKVKGKTKTRQVSAFKYFRKVNKLDLVTLHYEITATTVTTTILEIIDGSYWFKVGFG